MRRILHLAVHDTKLFILARENFFFMFLMPVMRLLLFTPPDTEGHEDDHQTPQEQDGAE